MNVTKLIVSLGAAAVATRVVKAVTNLGVDDMLDFVGLERRRGHGWEKLVLFGAGAVAGAGAALLLAPTSGRETREKLGQGMDKLATKATEALAEAKEQAPELLGRIAGESSTSRTAGNQGR
jgi:YtxH-like protein